jgi:hypothetical protein
MIAKVIMFFTGLIVIGFLFLVQNAFSKPIYNKMSNVWEDDSDGRKLAQFTIVAMLIIAFLLGRMLS